MRLRNVTKTHGDVVALDGVSLAFEPGTVHALAGPNGSGKTTALRLLAGLTRPSSGTVERPDGPGYAFQQPNVYPGLTVAENLDVFAAMVDADPAWRAELVERLRLAPARERVAAALSDGYRKKLDLALALLKQPDVLLLDEPLADLDDLTVTHLVELLADYRSDDRTVVVSSHRLERLSGLLDRMTVVFDGEIIAEVATDFDAPAAYAAAVGDADGHWEQEYAPRRSGPRMVEQTERDGMTWYRCEMCGLMFDDEEDAEQHESNCDAEDPEYLQ